MKKGFSFKKVLSAAAAFAISASTLLQPFGASAAFPDVPEDYSYRKAITTLSKLDVIDGYEDGTFAPNNDITRAEFTKLLVYLLGYGEISSKISRFEDLPEDHWANENIATAYSLGIVNGYSDTEFGPDNAVTYEQALKMVVCALGYQTAAEALGGYPTGYISEANGLKLNDGITASAYTDNATRGLVAQIMFNALEIDIMEPSGNTYVSSGKNLLNDYLNTYIMKGTIVGVGDSVTADCESLLSTGYFAIDDSETGDEYVIDYSEYASSNADISGYLGKTVQIYYTQERNSPDRYLLEIDNETYKNDEITIMSYDIESCSGNSLKYYPEGSTKTSTLRFPDTITVRYNGRAISGDVTVNDLIYAPTEVLKKWLDPSDDLFIYGTVRFIDTGATGTYNMVDIYDYDSIVALSAPTNLDYRIQDKTITGNYLTLDPDSGTYKYTLKKNNSPIEVTSVAAGDVINYAISLSGDFYTVYDTNKSITGTITSVNTTDSIPTISIDQTEYRVTDRFISYIENKDNSKLEAGVSITAYLDIFGALEWGTITKTTAYYPYAYVVNVAQDGEDYYIRMFAPTNTALTSFTSSTSYKVQTFKIQESGPKLGTKKSSPEAIINALSASAELPDDEISGVTAVGTGYNQLVKVGFNSSGEISTIILLDSDSEGNTNEDSGSLVRYKAMNSDAKYYVSSSSIKESKEGTTYYSIKSTTPLFVIPKNRTDTDSYALKSAITSNSMVAGSSYYIDAFDLNTSKYPGCMLVYNTTFKSGTSITYSTAYRLVSEDIKEEYDENEGDVFQKLYTYNTATTVTKTNIASDALDLFSNIGKGDVILNGTDGDKYADSVMLAIDYDKVRDVLSQTADSLVTVSDADGNTRIEHFNWTAEQEQTEENNWQKYIFDFRYPKTSLTAPTDDYYITGGNATGISSRAFMCNVKQVLTDENLLYVTRDGFDESGNLNDENYMDIKIASTTKYLRYDTETKSFTPYAEGTESTAITAQDLKAADDYGDACSKILITYVSGTTTTSSTTPTAKFIIIYDIIK